MMRIATTICMVAAVIVATLCIVVVFSDKDGRHRSTSVSLNGRSRLIASVKRPTEVKISKPDKNFRFDLFKKSNDVDVSTNLVAIMPEGASDEKLMEHVVSELMVMLEDAVRSKDRTALLDVLDKLRRINYGRMISANGRFSGGSSTGSRIMEILSELGPDGLLYAIDFLGDSDAAVAESAVNVLFRQLSNYGMPDYERADIVIAAAGELSGFDNLNRLFNEFVKFRHSVGAKVIEGVMKSGTAEAKEIMPRVIKAFTGDTSITTVAEVKEWLEDNPDSPLDDWFYGKQPLNSDN